MSENASIPNTPEGSNMLHQTRRAFILLAATGSLPVYADLNLSDPSIINLYRLNEQTSGQLDNSVDGSFLDTAPTGTPQNHADFIDDPSDGPAWTTGAAYSSGSGTVGDGTGLSFTRADKDRTRVNGWMSTPQGNYSDGKSFSLMVRVKPGALADNQNYDLVHNGTQHGISLQGSGNPNTAGVTVSLRDQNTFWTFNGYGNSDPNYPGSEGQNSAGASFFVTSGQWSNLFLIYEANANPNLSRLTVAMDDGTGLKAQTSMGAPGGFDTIAEGFDNPGSPWFIGSNGGDTNTYDGLVESIVVWDKALTNEEAGAIGLLNALNGGGDSTWAVNNSGDWNVGTNWGTGEAPNAVGAVARFYGAITSNRTVYSDAAVTVGQILFNNPNTYVLSGSGTITMENTGIDPALIDVLAGTQKISIPLVIASNTTLSVASGATLKISNPMTINSGKNVTQTGDGTVLYESIVTVQPAASIGFVNSTHANSLILQGTASASVATHVGGSPTTLQLDSLSMDAASTLDLKNNRLKVKSSAATIRSAIQAGDITSSLATSTQNLGYADLGGGNIEVLYTLLGDANLDLQVTSADFNAFVAGYGSTSGGVWTNGDFNYDNKVNTLDFNSLAGNFGATLSSPTLGSVVPEPGCVLAIAGMLAPAMLRRRRA